MRVKHKYYYLCRTTTYFYTYTPKHSDKVHTHTQARLAH